MPVNYLKTSISRLYKDQDGIAFKDIAMLLASLTIVSIIVTYVFLGGSIFASSQDVTELSNPSNYITSPDVFSPITELEKKHHANPERVYSMVRGAIADLENSQSDNVCIYSQLNQK